MDLSKKKIRVTIVSVIFVLAFFVAGFFLLSGDRTNIEYSEDYVPFNDGWTVTLKDTATENATLPFRVETRDGEAVVFSRVLPADIHEHSAIITRNYHQFLVVKVDGETVYGYPNKEWTGFANLISDEWCLIPLDPEYAGKTIEVSLINSTAAAFKFRTSIGDFYYGERDSLVAMVRKQSFVPVIMGIIVTVIGALILMVSVIYRHHTNQAPNTAMGIAFICFGIWLTNRAKMCLFPDHSIFAYFGSLICLMLVAPFLFLYTYYRNAAFKKLAYWGFLGCLYSDLFLILTSLIIRYDIEYIAAFSYGLSMLALGLNAYSLFLGGFVIKQKRPIDKILDRTEFLANMIFPVCAVMEFTMFRQLLWTEASMYLRSAVLFYSVSYMIFVLWRTFLVVRDRTVVTKQLHDSQTELMMGQIQPHFIFNTLSSIRTLVMVDQKIAYDMLYDFSNYLRANIDNVTNLDGIKFADEVEHIKSYVNIEKVRFGDRLTMEYEIGVGDFIVPPLSVQPLIENAIKHGVRKKVSGGIVCLKSYESTEYNIVEVTDDGTGFNQENADRVFGDYAQDGAGSSSATEMNIALMADVMDNLNLYDADGNKIVVKQQVVEEDLPTTNKHKSTGLVNTLIRLREMADAKIEITSHEGEGTTIKVYFRKKKTEEEQQ